MKAPGFKAMWWPRLPSVAKLTLRLCLQADDLRLPASTRLAKRLGSARRSVYCPTTGPACDLATAIPLRLVRRFGEYSPL